MVKRKKKKRGSRSLRFDRKRKVLRPGRRISRTGKKYTERRPNRSDKGKFL